LLIRDVLHIGISLSTACSLSRQFLFIFHEPFLRLPESLSDFNQLSQSFLKLDGMRQDSRQTGDNLDV
jgi:hypothetical protein